MSKIQRNLCSVILKEHYGETVQQVCDYLLKCGSKPLRVIQADTKIPLHKVKQALCVLIQHSFVNFAKNEKRGYIEYAVVVENILYVLRYPRYIYCTKTLYGDVAELITEEILENGQITMEQIVNNVLDRFKDNSETSSTVTSSVIYERFTSLVKTHLIKQCPKLVVGEGQVSLPTFADAGKNLFEIPKLDTELTGKKRKLSDPVDEPSGKRRKIQEPTGDGSGIYWTINFDRFHEYFRDEIAVKAIGNKLDEKAAGILQSMLRVAETKNDPWQSYSAPLSRQEILRNACNDKTMNGKDLDSYLSVLVDDKDSGCTRSGDSGGGTYAINYCKIVNSLLLVTIRSIVEERFGSKCSRIFRLIMLKHYLEQKQIEELAMIPAKDCKELAYKMFEEHFLEIQEIPKTPDYAPSRTFYLFHVNLQQLTRDLLETCYKSAFNAITKRELEVKKNRRLLEKKQKVDAILATVKETGGDETQLKEVEETITPSETLQLSRINRVTEKLEHAELRLDETIFILQLAIKYQAFKS